MSVATPKTNADEERRPDQSARIMLKVNSQNGDDVFFRIKRNVQLRKMMKAYCVQNSVDFNSVAFLFNGRRLGEEETPEELKMENGDQIDAMLHQTGGAP